MNPNKALWEKGDFTRIAETMRESGETLVGKLGITKGLKVCFFRGRSDCRPLFLRHSGFDPKRHRPSSTVH
jgi:hypothetical protein